MPAVFRYKRYRFFFYANEGTPREPIHIHVDSGEGEAKIWMQPTVQIAYNDGYSPRVLRELILVAATERRRIEEAWNDFFNT